jgi:hypothetical protein
LGDAAGHSQLSAGETFLTDSVELAGGIQALIGSGSCGRLRGLWLCRSLVLWR